MSAVRLPAVENLRNADQVHVLAHPIRIRMLEMLREPLSAAAVARRIGEPRQKINYHLKELERAGLVRRTGERRAGNFVESIYQAVARTFVVSPRVAWGGRRRAKALGAQVSLRTLVALGERLQRDAAALLDHAAFDGAEISSASVATDLRFENEDARAAFMSEYLAVVGPLLKRYGAKQGAPYRMLLAVYPQPEGEREGV